MSDKQAPLSKHDQGIHQGAVQMADLLDKGKIDAFATRLSSDLSAMKPADQLALIKEINKLDKKGTGYDLKDIDLSKSDWSTLTAQSNGYKNVPGMIGIHPDHRDLALASKHGAVPLAHFENDKYIQAGAGFAESEGKRKVQEARDYEKFAASNYPERRDLPPKHEKK